MSLTHLLRDRIECMRVRPLLQAWLDGELTGEQAELVAGHLEACRRCGLAADTFRALKDGLGRLGEPPERDAVDRLAAFVEELTETDDEQTPG